MKFTVPVVFTIEAASPEAAKIAANTANKQLNDRMVKLIFQGYGVRLDSALVGDPVAK